MRGKIIAALGVLLTIPIFLTAIYYLTPRSFQQFLAFDHTNPQLHTLWTSALVHNHTPYDSHPLGNVLAYLLVVLPCWRLATHRNWARQFWTELAVLLLATPVIVNTTSYIVFEQVLDLGLTNGRGFSGVVAGLAGFLIATILYTFAETQDEPVAILSIGLYFGFLFLGVGAVTQRLMPVVGGAAIMAAMIAATRTQYVAELDQLAAWNERNPALAGLLVIAVLTSAFVFGVSLPTEIVQDGVLTNVIGHGAGLLFGMLVGRRLHARHRSIDMETGVLS